LKNPDFVNGQFNTSFVENHPELINYCTPRPRELLVAAISAAVAAHEGV
jgi:pyruvate carboxylase subunit A